MCVYKRNIFCLLRLCLLLCGVGCFIPSEDSRPALLTGTSDLSKNGHLAVTRSQCCRRHTLTYHFLSTTNLVFSYEAIPLKMLNVYFKFDKEICHFLRQHCILSESFNDSCAFCLGSTLEVPPVYEGLGCTALGHKVKVKLSIIEILN